MIVDWLYTEKVKYIFKLTIIFKVSDGGVHSHINHLFSMIEAAKLLQVPNCFVQFFSDGRDTRPNSGGKIFLFINDFIHFNIY